MILKYLISALLIGGAGWLIWVIFKRILAFESKTFDQFGVKFFTLKKTILYMVLTAIFGFSVFIIIVSLYSSAKHVSVNEVSNTKHNKNTKISKTEPKDFNVRDISIKDVKSLFLRKDGNYNNNEVFFALSLITIICISVYASIMFYNIKKTNFKCGIQGSLLQISILPILGILWIIFFLLYCSTGPGSPKVKVVYR